MFLVAKEYRWSERARDEVGCVASSTRPEVRIVESIAAAVLKLSAIRFGVWHLKVGER